VLRFVGVACAQNRLDAVDRAQGRRSERLSRARRLWPQRPAYRETDVETADLETVILGLLEGEYNNPIRVVAFNTAEGWSRDASADIAQELRRRCDLQMRDVPYNIHESSSDTTASTGS